MYGTVGGETLQIWPTVLLKQRGLELLQMRQVEEREPVMRVAVAEDLNEGHRHKSVGGYVVLHWST